MKILLSSYRFAPDIGGIETASEIFAHEFSAAGHEVRVLTQSGDDDGRERPFEIVRLARPGELLKQTAWCDVFFQNNISLQNLWAALLLRKPWVVAHQTWISTGEQPDNWRVFFKRLILRRATNVAISRAIARELPVSAGLIGNPYNNEVFRLRPEIERTRELVYVGRLVSDKGVDVLLDALALLAARGLRPRLSIVGSGPEEARLRTQTESLGLSGQVEFRGAMTGEPLAELLNAHRAIVVPSRWAEPFGIVALEGIACGCVAVGSEAGGLCDAIGACGITFPNGNGTALADALQRILTDEPFAESLRAGAPAHLARHTAAAVSAEYLGVFRKVLR